MYAEAMTMARQPLGWREAALLLAGYVALDWVSYIRPLEHLNITPWNPAPALAVLFLLRHGPVALLPLAAGMIVADVAVRHMALWSIAVFLSLGLAAGYLAIAATLKRALRGTDIFESPGELWRWGLIVIGGTLATSTLFVGTHAILGLLAGADWIDAVQRHWIGDAAGILVSMPFFWVMLDTRRRHDVIRFVTTLDFGLIALSLLAALWLTFGAEGEAAFKYLYVLFAPVAYAAARHEIAGAVTTASLVHIGVVTAAQWRGIPTLLLVDIQWLVLGLAMLAFFLAVVVAERDRIGAELRQTLRIAAAGEMAAALAHELNQPLTALTAYGAACEKMVARGDPPDRIANVVRSIAAEALRTGEIVRRLRDFFRFGNSRMEAADLFAITQQAAAQFTARAQRENVLVEISHDGDTAIIGDRVQLEVVLRNLIANAFDAVAGLDGATRRIDIRLSPWGADQIGVTVADNGPGLTHEVAARLFEPFRSDKSSGMGLGLAVSRSIVLAHGGALWAEESPHGLFRMTLPRAVTPGES